MDFEQTPSFSHGLPLHADVSKINKAHVIRLNLKTPYNKCDSQAKFFSSFPHDAS